MRKRWIDGILPRLRAASAGGEPLRDTVEDALSLLREKAGIRIVHSNAAEGGG